MYEIIAVDGLVRHTVPVDRPDDRYTLKNALRDQITTSSPWPLAAGHAAELAARGRANARRWPTRVQITRTATQTK